MQIQNCNEKDEEDKDDLNLSSEGVLNSDNTFSIQMLKEESNMKIVNRPLTEEEEKYLERWEQYSEEMDSILNEISSELEVMLQKLETIEQEQNTNMKMADSIDRDVVRLKKDVEFNNTQLKLIVKSLRSPGKICADLTLGLVLSILIGVLVYVIRLYFTL